MSDQTISISTRSFKVRAILGGAIVVAAAFAWFSVRWQLGDMIGELTSPGEPGAAEISKVAISLAPADPRSNWILGAVYRSEFTPESTERSVAQMLTSVRLSPYQYRWWSELGRSYEQAGRFEEAESAFKRAVELAPEYTLANWQLGNFYLRRSRIDEAIGPLKKAAEHSGLYRAQVFSIAWSYFGNDPKMVEQFSNGEPEVRAGLVEFYANMNRPDDAIRVWNSLSPDEKAQFNAIADGAARKLFVQRSYLAAIEFSRQAGIDKYARPGAFTNGDLESPIRKGEPQLFDWSINTSDSKVDIGIDTDVHHEGKRSLRVLFRAAAVTPNFNLDQLIAVRPGSRQRIEFWIRTENLRSGGMPQFEVLSGMDDKPIAAAKSFPVGTNEWQLMEIEFEVPANTQGIRVRVSREPCGPECPIAGLFWMDDLRITEIGQR